MCYSLTTLSKMTTIDFKTVKSPFDISMPNLPQIPIDINSKGIWGTGSKRYDDMERVKQLQEQWNISANVVNSVHKLINS